MDRLAWVLRQWRHVDLRDVRAQLVTLAGTGFGPADRAPIRPKPAVPRPRIEHERLVPPESGNSRRTVDVVVTPALGSKGHEMATDYDAPRQKESDDTADESLEALAGRRNDAATAVIDVDDYDELEGFE